jgi:hypothetical protein
MPMNITEPQSIRDYIVAVLVSGPQTTALVLSKIQKNQKITKQAFYTALRQLQQEEVVIKYKETISLDTTWILKLQENIFAMERSYIAGNQSGLLHFLALNDGESATYQFQSIAQLDQFWGNIQNLALMHTVESEALFVYDPHYWFFLARNNTETELLKNLTKNKRPFLMSVAGATSLDVYIKKNAQNDFIRINNGEQIFNKDNYYVTVIGDYIWEITIDMKIAHEVAALFQEYAKPSDTLATRLEELIQQKSKNKFKISRSVKKAQSLRKKLGKNFHIK